MTIAAASFFTATSPGGAPAPAGTATALPGFAAAMGTALATPSAGAPVPATGSPVLPGAMLPPQAALVDVTAAAMPIQATGLLDPNGIAPAPGVTTADAPAVPPSDGIAPAKTAQRFAAATPLEAQSAGQGAQPASSPEQHVAIAAPAVAQAPVIPTSAPDQALPAIATPDEAEPQTEQPAAAEPSGPVQLANLIIEAEDPATPPTAAVPLTASPATLPPPGEPVSDEPVAAARTQPATSPGKPSATAETAREPAPAAAHTQPSSFAERVDATQSPTPNAGPAASQPAVRSAETSAPAAPSAAPQEPTVTARPGQIGREMGVEIARRLGAGGDELTVRLNPVEMGRIEVRLSFDDRGSLRAFVAAESPAALDMLRRDSADLGRALTDAGVRADAGSFRFDSRSGSGEGGQFWQRQQTANGRRSVPSGSDDPSDLQPIYRPLRTSGRVDLVA